MCQNLQWNLSLILCVKTKDSVNCPSLCTILQSEPPGSRSWMHSVLVLWSECYLRAAVPRMLPISTPSKRHQGIRKTQLIERVFFSIGSHQLVANCFRYLIEEQTPLKTGEQSTIRHCCLLCDRNNLTSITHWSNVHPILLLTRPCSPASCHLLLLVRGGDTPTGTDISS